MAFEAITQVAEVRFVRDTHAMSTHATADQSLEQRFPFPCGSTRPLNSCLLRMCFLRILGQTRLIAAEIVPN